MAGAPARGDHGRVHWGTEAETEALRPQDRAKDGRHHHGRRTRGGSARSLGEDTPANTLTLNFRPPEL